MVAMLSQTGLVLFATFVGLSKKEDGRLKRSYEAFAAWCFLIFFVYVSAPDCLCLRPHLRTHSSQRFVGREQSIFAGITFAFKDDIIDRE